MNRRPLLAFVACWTAGDAILSMWNGEAAALAFAGALLLVAACALFLRARPAIFAACALALLLAGGERAWTDWRHASQLSEAIGDPDGAEVAMVGRIASAVSVDGDLVAFKLQAASVAPIGRAVGAPVGLDAAKAAGGGGQSDEARKLSEPFWVRVKLAEESELQTAAGWRRGDLLRLEGKAQLPADAGNFGGFDYRAYLSRQHIHWIVSVQGAKAVHREDRPTPWRMLPLRWTDEARARIGAWMDGLYGERDAGLMKGLVAGIQDDVDPAQYNVYSNLGLTHVLAISGLHVGVLVFILLRLWALLRLTRERALELTIAALPVYMLLTGASPSAIRACLMGMIALYMARRHKLKDGLHLLAASALVMMAWDPLVIENVSFQLSFIVTAGLILFAPTVTEWLPIRRRGLRGAVAVAVTAQAVSFPVSVYYFHQFHLLSLLANLVLVPFISFVVMPLGMASAALAALWRPLGQLAADAASWCNRLTDAAMAALNGVPGMQTFWPQASLAWVAAAYAVQFATIAWMKRSLRARREREWLSQPPEPASARERARPSAPRPGAAGPGSASSAPSDEETRPLLPAEPPRPRRRDARELAGRFALPGALALAWLLWLVWGFQPAALDRDGQVMFLDVGQGDSILIRTGAGGYGLIDAGGTVQFGKAKEAWRQRKDPYEVGKKTIVPLLKQRGVRSLDVLVLTHFDQDHIGGAAAVLSDIPVRRLIFNGTIKPDQAVDRLFRIAEQKRVPVYAAGEGLDWRWDRTAKLRVLHPAISQAAALAETDDQNDRSVVLLLELYGRTFLLPGDLEAAGELAVRHDWLEEAEPVDVLKAGHHGSKTSTTDEWLALWRPAETVISVGRNNLYGHPHPTVLQRLAASGIPFYRTDLNGEVQYRITPAGELLRRLKRPSAAL